MSADSSIIVNALIRCTRRDRAAGPVFELVRGDLGLWILELGCRRPEPWNSQINLIADEIGNHRAKLTDLRTESFDYTLHLFVQLADSLPLRIPYKLSALAYECGFEIEIHVESQPDNEPTPPRFVSNLKRQIRMANIAKSAAKPEGPEGRRKLAGE